MQIRAGIERVLASGADQRVWGWFGLIYIRVLMVGARGGRVRGRPRLGRMDGVKM